MPPTGRIANDRRLDVFWSNASQERPKIVNFYARQSPRYDLILAEKTNARQAGSGVRTSDYEEMHSPLPQRCCDYVPKSIGTG